jgi:pimeloyl-ACP methyl ester carboxylesterase
VNRPTRLRVRVVGVRVRAVFLIAFSALLMGLLGVVGLLLVWSYPGKPQPFVDERGTPLPASLSEKIFIDVNGVKQGMIIESKNTANPVMLYLHGTMPDYFLTRRYPTGMEDLFTMVWWEQRGAGLSYSPDIAKASLTSEQYIADTLAVTDYLRQRFGQDRIYLMGHSNGTFFGIQAAARAPEKYHAYIGVAQMTNQMESERLAYDYMLTRFRELGDLEMVRKLEAAPVTLHSALPAGYVAIRDEAMHRLGVGTMHTMTNYLQGLFVGSLQTREYTLGEKVGLWRGKFSAGVTPLLDEVTTTDLARTLPSVDLPVYLFHGSYDYTVNYALAKAYAEALRAPLKGFYTFEQSAHSPMFEEPQKMLRLLRENVLTRTNSLADARGAPPRGAADPTRHSSSAGTARPAERSRNTRRSSASIGNGVGR